MTRLVVRVVTRSATDGIVGVADVFDGELTEVATIALRTSSNSIEVPGVGSYLVRVRTPNGGEARRAVEVGDSGGEVQVDMSIPRQKSAATDHPMELPMLRRSEPQFSDLLLVPQTSGEVVVTPVGQTATLEVVYDPETSMWVPRLARGSAATLLGFLRDRDLAASQTVVSALLDQDGTPDVYTSFAIGYYLFRHHDDFAEQWISDLVDRWPEHLDPILLRTALRIRDAREPNLLHLFDVGMAVYMLPLLSEGTGLLTDCLRWAMLPSVGNEKTHTMAALSLIWLGHYLSARYPGALTMFVAYDSNLQPINGRTTGPWAEDLASPEIKELEVVSQHVVLDGRFIFEFHSPVLADHAAFGQGFVLNSDRTSSHSDVDSDDDDA